MTQFNDAFWRWFGDSKVVDGKGNPLVVYHGTGEAGISVFKTGTGAWFSTDSDLAAAYSGSRSWEGGAPTLYSVYLRMTRPLKINAESRLKTTREELAAAVGFAWSRSKKIDRTTGWPVDWRYVKVFQFVHTPEFVRAAANEGYDGIIMPEGRALTFGVFSPTQIKSATGNDGTWDADDPDITSNPPGSKKIGRATLEYGHIASDRMLPVLVFEGKKYGPDDIIDGFPAGSVVVTIISGQKSMSNETLRAAKKFVGQSLQHGLRWLEAIEGWEGAPQEDDPANWDADDPDITSNPWIDDEVPPEGEYRVGELHWNTPMPPKSKGLVLRDGSYVWWATKPGPDGAEPHHDWIEEDLAVVGYRLNEIKYPDDPQNAAAQLTASSRVSYIELLDPDAPLCAARELLRCFKGLKMNSELTVSTGRQDGEFEGTVSDFAKECKYLKS